MLLQFPLQLRPIQDDLLGFASFAIDVVVLGERFVKLGDEGGSYLGALLIDGVGERVGQGFDALSDFLLRKVEGFLLLGTDVAVDVVEFVAIIGEMLEDNALFMAQE